MRRDERLSEERDVEGESEGGGEREPSDGSPVLLEIEVVRR